MIDHSVSVSTVLILHSRWFDDSPLGTAPLPSKKEATVDSNVRLMLIAIVIAIMIATPDSTMIAACITNNDRTLILGKMDRERVKARQMKQVP